MIMKIIICGCNGKMGKAIVKATQNYNDCEIAAGVDKIVDSQASFPTYTSIENIKEKADVIIDFSHPSALDSILNYSKKTNTPAVLCTTGFNNEQVEKIKNASKTMPVFYSRNMSLGINLLIELAKKTTEILEKDFDIEIIEKHHNQKIDAPSGTALMIAEGISQTCESKKNFIYDRSSTRKAREKSEIGIHSLRGGTIPGDHEVIFAGNKEIITISHHAESRDIFANGALKAAYFLKDKPKGFYTMKDVIHNQF